MTFGRITLPVDFSLSSSRHAFRFTGRGWAECRILTLIPDETKPQGLEYLDESSQVPVFRCAGGIFLFVLGSFLFFLINL